MIDRPTIERILDAAQIVDVVQEFVPLKKRGSTTWDYARFITRRHLHLQFHRQRRSSSVSAAERLEILSIL